MVRASLGCALAALLAGCARTEPDRAAEAAPTPDSAESTETQPAPDATVDPSSWVLQERQDPVSLKKVSSVTADLTDAERPDLIARFAFECAGNTPDDLQLVVATFDTSAPADAEAAGVPLVTQFTANEGQVSLVDVRFDGLFAEKLPVRSGQYENQLKLSIGRLKETLLQQKYPVATAMVGYKLDEYASHVEDPAFVIRVATLTGPMNLPVNLDEPGIVKVFSACGVVRGKPAQTLEAAAAAITQREKDDEVRERQAAHLRYLTGTIADKDEDLKGYESELKKDSLDATYRQMLLERAERTRRELVELRQSLSNATAPASEASTAAN